MAANIALPYICLRQFVYNIICPLFSSGQLLKMQRMEILSEKEEIYTTYNPILQVIFADLVAIQGILFPSLSSGLFADLVAIGLFWHQVECRFGQFGWHALFYVG